MIQLLRYRDLVRALVLRDLKVRYRRSTIGFLWTMLQPLLTMLVLSAVFSALFRFDIPNYPVYALAGIMFWNFFSQSITASMNSLRGNAHLFTKVPVPKEVFPVATVVAGVINLLLALIPLFAILLVTGHPIRPALLFLPAAILLAALFTLGAGLLLSPLAVFFHDIIEMVSVLLTLFMYLTPLFYPDGHRARALPLGGPLQPDPLGPRGVPRPDLLRQDPTLEPPHRGRHHHPPGARRRHRGVPQEQRPDPVLRMSPRAR
jgi:ABC-type polysaccharide/polyol phosphate export permease